MTYAKRGPEAFAEAIAAMLRTWLPAEITAVNAAWADETPLVAPVAYRVFNRGVEGGPFPVVMVEPDAGRQVSQGQTVWAEVTHNAVVTIWLDGDDALTVKRQRSRYLWALWQTLMKHPDLDGSLGAIGVDIGEYALTGFQGEKTPRLFGAAAWRVSATIAELAQS